jgi:hypothetical protein
MYHYRGSLSHWRVGAAGIAVILAFLAPLLSPAAVPISPGHENALPKRLSETGLYRDISTKSIYSGAVPFEPQYPLWSDGAGKRRWIRLPDGETIDATNPDRWEFPVGTVFFKEFVFPVSPADPRSPKKRVETRVSRKVGPGTWQYGAYIWNEDETEAVLAPDEGIPSHFPIANQLRHDVPSQKQCRQCHEKGGDPVLGFDQLQLSADRDPAAPHAGAPAPGSLDMEALLARGWIRTVGALDPRPRLRAESGAARAALGYLHANCGSCHNPEGSAKSSGLFLRFSFLAGGEREQPAFVTSVDKLARLYALPDRDETFRVRAGKPEESALAYRMAVRGPGQQMPPIGTRIVDRDGLGAVERWISELK